MATVTFQHPAAPPAASPHLRLPEHAHILVVKLAGLGDVLLTMPALRALRHAYPHAQLDLLVDESTLRLVRDSPLVNRVLSLDKTLYDRPWNLARSPWRLARLIRRALQLRRTRYDAVLLCHHLTLPSGRLKYRLLLFAVGNALRVGLDNGTGRFLDVCVPDQGFGALHEAAYARALAQALITTPITEHLAPTLADLGWTPPRPRHVPDAAEVRIALHPGGGAYSLARRWPLERYIELARALHSRYHASIVVIAGPQEGAEVAAMRSALGAPAWLSLPTTADSPRELASLLASCELFIGNDAFPMHLAAACGIPVVAIFGPSNHRAWRPLARAWAGPALVVRRALPCSPCFYVGHGLGTPQGCSHRSCLTALGVETVLAQVRQALRRQLTAEPEQPPSGPRRSPRGSLAHDAPLG